MLQFMRKKNYKFEADYIEVVLNWRRSSDECGLSQHLRMKYNYEMLNFLLDDLMPWHRQLYDFSTLEVNRLALCTLAFNTHIKKVYTHCTDTLVGMINSSTMMILVCGLRFSFIVSVYFLTQEFEWHQGTVKGNAHCPDYHN